MAEHPCNLPRPLDVGERFACSCGARFVAVRRRWWSGRLRWERLLFDLPTAARPRKEDGE